MKNSLDTSDKESPSMKKKKAKAIYEDGDDAHFSDNPAVGKRSRKRIAGSSKGHPAVKVTKKNTSRKRVAGK